MILSIMMVLAGVGWVIATSFFRSVVDPWFNAYPLLSALVMATVLLTYATILLLAGSNFGKPLPEKKKGKIPFSAAPPLYYILQWSLVGAIFILSGFFTIGMMPYLSGFLWLTGTITMLSQFLFLMIPGNFRQETGPGKVDLIPNRLRLKDQAYHFWDTCIMAGGFFLVTGTLLKPISIVAGLLSIGTGLSWLLGAVSFSLVSTFHLSGAFRKKTPPSSYSVPEDTLSVFPRNNPTRMALIEAYSAHLSARSLFRSQKNGILLWGPSVKANHIFARALAGESGRAYMTFELASLRGLSLSTAEHELRNTLYKIHLYKPVLLHITDFEASVSSLSQPERESLKKILLRLLMNKHALVVMNAHQIDDIPEEFKTPPVVHWVIGTGEADTPTRTTFLRLALREVARQNEILPGQVPLLTLDMIDGYDLFKLAEMMEGFSPEDIDDVLLRSIKSARSLRRSLRQLDIDVSIRRKMQGWQDPTLEPMEAVRARLTEEAIAPALIINASEKILKQKRHTSESLLIVGKSPSLRQKLAQTLAQRENYHFASVSQKEFSRDSLGTFRNFVIQNKKLRPAVLFVDPLEVLFPRVQLSHFSYHGEIYNQKVIELSQVLQERQFWLICGTSGINDIDPMILRKFSRVIEIGDIQKEFLQDVEAYAMEKLLEGFSSDNIDFSRFHLFTGTSPFMENSSDDKNQTDKSTFALTLPEELPPPIRDYFGRESLQNEILATLETGRLKIRKDGSALSGTFFFLGPPQSGRKFLAEALSRQVYKKPEAFVYRDMSLFDELFFAEQFLKKSASPAPTNPPVPDDLWEVFHQDPRRLLYMDNVEKAHPSLWNALLPVLKTGRLSWGEKTRDISDSIFVLASTLFSPQDFAQVEPWSRPDVMIQAVRNNNRRLAYLPLFQPPFLQHVDLILPFPEYSTEDIHTILRQTATKILHDFSRNIPFPGTLSVEPGLFEQLTSKLDISRRGMDGLDRKLQSQFLSALTKIRATFENEPGPHDFLLSWDGRGISAVTVSPSEQKTEEEAVVSP
ncbi:MAG: putative ATP-dependent Clp protease [Leptospirillum sp. Group II 'C75']|uniref:AAA family ATPase n=1 Tax=Leptospirillum sp. Group II 'CF-1' TaxID=1660083 RepID=UPI0000F0CBFC|nr:AAA family ATPase [Leptospirillum sp. Group II 'CF-1']AKS23769.1 hypothetical protein ABH19_08485 [Leptospirillum sp. Group II 'CF-1']EAY57228.1 MAG: probable ATP-dependent Clp protease [Leptospirillum rubarum]EIJ76859.1 MAG: putative ATP-dependent Clp protease [Leptospirillum sp. Group II 'C75']